MNTHTSSDLLLTYAIRCIAPYPMWLSFIGPRPSIQAFGPNPTTVRIDCPVRTKTLGRGDSIGPQLAGSGVNV